MFFILYIDLFLIIKELIRILFVFHVFVAFIYPESSLDVHSYFVLLQPYCILLYQRCSGLHREKAGYNPADKKDEELTINLKCTTGVLMTIRLKPYVPSSLGKRGGTTDNIL